MDERNQVRKQIIVFLLVTSIFTALLFIWMFYFASGDRGMYGALMMFVPAVSALVTSLFTKDKIRSYGWRIGKLRYHGYAYILPILVALVAYGTMGLIGAIDFYPDEVVNYKWARILGFETPAPIWIGMFSKAFLGFIMIFILATGEEIGWSGFLTPKLLKVTTIPTTALIVGVYWSLWHLPALIGGIYNSYYDAPLFLKVVGFTLVLIASALIKTVLIAKSGSLWVGSILHASHNVFLMGMAFDLTVKQGIAGYLVSETGLVTAFVYLVVAIWFWRRQVKKHQS